MFQSIFSIEQSMILKQTILRVELALMALLVALLTGLMYASTYFPGEAVDAESAGQLLQSMTWPGAFVNALSMSGGSGLGSIFIIILTGAVVAQEFHWRTLHLWISRGVPRVSYALARFASLLLPGLMLVIAGLLAGGLVSLFLTLATYGALPLEQIHWGQLLLSILRSTYTLLPYASLAFLLAIVTRSSVVAIGAGLSFSLLVENILAQLLVMFGGAAGQLVKYLPADMANALVRENSAIAIAAAQSAVDAPAMPSLPVWGAAAGIALYTLLFLALAAWSLYKQDLTA